MKSIIVFILLSGVVSALNNVAQTSNHIEIEQQFVNCISKRIQDHPLNPFLGAGESIVQTIPFIKTFCWDMTIFRTIVIQCREVTKAGNIQDQAISGALRDSAILFRETCKNTTKSAETAVCIHQQFEQTERQEKFPCENFSQESEKIHKALEICKVEPTLQDVLKRGLEAQKKNLCSQPVNF